MHENIFAAFARDESEALRVVEPLYCSLLCHFCKPSSQLVYVALHSNRFAKRAHTIAENMVFRIVSGWPTILELSDFVLHHGVFHVEQLGGN